ncbi:terminase [Paraburkholderia tropica]|uniref:terminase small subunit-like protein n=1 Tax=Paraburkholderia tropica TaxID=92647 RepID=UPI0032B3E843
MGRPTLFTLELAAEICERLAVGEPLASICRDGHMPAVRTVSDWKRDHGQFSADFARAREDGADAIAADCLDIADDATNDTIVTDRGEQPNTEWISRSRLRVETRLKLLAKWFPKTYGDKIDVTTGNESLNLTAEQRAARLAAIGAAAATRREESDDGNDLL